VEQGGFGAGFSDGEDALVFVISANIHRRYLASSQSVAITLEVEIEYLASIIDLAEPVSLFDCQKQSGFRG
jgi:hypothetical protein